MNQVEANAYRKLRRLIYFGLLLFAILTLALTGHRDPAVILLVAFAGLVSTAFNGVSVFTLTLPIGDVQ